MTSGAIQQGAKVLLCFRYLWICRISEGLGRFFDTLENDEHSLEGDSSLCILSARQDINFREL